MPVAPLPQPHEQGISWQVLLGAVVLAVTIALLWEYLPRAGSNDARLRALESLPQNPAIAGWSAADREKTLQALPSAKTTLTEAEKQQLLQNQP